MDEARYARYACMLMIRQANLDRGIDELSVANRFALNH
nr:hypothetical protein Q903MT_gene78 [Picea sitchensis]